MKNQYKVSKQAIIVRWIIIFIHDIIKLSKHYKIERQRIKIMEIKIEIPFLKIIAIVSAGAVGYIAGWLIYR